MSQNCGEKTCQEPTIAPSPKSVAEDLVLDMTSDVLSIWKLSSTSLLLLSSTPGKSEKLRKGLIQVLGASTGTHQLDFLLKADPATRCAIDHPELNSILVCDDTVSSYNLKSVVSRLKKIQTSINLTQSGHHQTKLLINVISSIPAQTQALFLFNLITTDILFKANTI